RKGADHATIADLSANALDRDGDERTRGPRWLAAANTKQEVAEHLAPAGGVDHLRVELDAIDPVAVGEGSERRVPTGGEGAETGRHLRDRVAVAHPDRQLTVESLEQAGLFAHRHQGGAVLVRAPGVDLATEVMSDQLHAVADAE